MRRASELRAVGNSEFVMCNWQYELWLVTIYSVILHVLLSVNSGHAKYTSMAFFSKKKLMKLSTRITQLVHIPSPYQRNAYIYYISRIFWWNHGSGFFYVKGENVFCIHILVWLLLYAFCFWLHNMFLPLFLFSLSSFFYLCTRFSSFL